MWLTVPADLDLAICDGGEYRIWEAHDGTPRTAQPGERVRIDISDMEPGLVAIASSTLQDASPSLAQQVESVLASLSVNRPPPDWTPPP